MRKGRRGGAVLAVVCLLALSLAMHSGAVSQQIAVVGGKAAYADGERLQMEARLVPPQTVVRWVWWCRMPDGEEDVLPAEAARLVLDLTTAHHGAVIWPEATLADGTTLRGAAQTLQVEAYCLKLELAALPSKTQYAPGDAFVPDGMRVEAVMSDGSRADVTALCRWTDAPLMLETQAVEVTCLLLTAGGDWAEFGCRVPVQVQQPPEDDPANTPKEEEPEADAPVFAPGDNQTGKPDGPVWSKQGIGPGAVALLATAGVVAAVGIGCLWRISRGKETDADEDGDASAP